MTKFAAQCAPVLARGRCPCRPRSRPCSAVPTPLPMPCCSPPCLLLQASAPSAHHSLGLSPSCSLSCSFFLVLAMANGCSKLPAAAPLAACSFLLLQPLTSPLPPSSSSAQAPPSAVAGTAATFGRLYEGRSASRAPVLARGPRRTPHRLPRPGRPVLL